jgi:hypothetical protein
MAQERFFPQTELPANRTSVSGKDFGLLRVTPVPPQPQPRAQPREREGEIEQKGGAPVRRGLNFAKAAAGKPRREEFKARQDLFFTALTVEKLRELKQAAERDAYERKARAERAENREQQRKKTVMISGIQGAALIDGDGKTKRDDVLTKLSQAEIVPLDKRDEIESVECFMLNNAGFAPTAPPRYMLAIQFKTPKQREETLERARNSMAGYFGWSVFADMPRWEREASQRQRRAAGRQHY